MKIKNIGDLKKMIELGKNEFKMYLVSVKEFVSKKTNKTIYVSTFVILDKDDASLYRCFKPEVYNVMKDSDLFTEWKGIGFKTYDANRQPKYLITGIE